MGFGHAFEALRKSHPPEVPSGLMILFYLMC